MVRLLLLIVATLAAVPAFACSVPVFRYALEHWKGDAYQAIVFHRGPLTEAQRALVRDLGAEGLAGRLHANLSARTVDLDANPAPELRELSRLADAATLPWLLVTSPPAARFPQTVWSGPLTAAGLQPVLDSPARREIVARLARGQSAVWLLLESGDRDRDAAAAQLLETRLAYLAATLTLPKLDAQDIAKGLVSVGQDDLRLEFSVFRLARNTAGEEPFIQMLLGTEPDLSDVKEPMVIPVFGRGRALYALVGAGIRRETIDQAASFLIGKCSCQVKEQNPGTDLLLAANWDALIKAQTNAVPDLPSFAELARSAPVTVAITSGDTTFPARATESSPKLVGGTTAMLLAAGCLLGALLLFAFLSRRP